MRVAVSCWQMVLLWTIQRALSMPAVPRALKKKFDVEGTSLPYYIFLKLWVDEGKSEDEEEEACSVVIPDDLSFNLFMPPFDKDKSLTMVNTNQMSTAVRSATSPDPFKLLSDPSDKKGSSVFEESSIETPAFVSSFGGKNIYIWKSERDGTLLANGAEVLFHENLDKNCVLVVAKNFAFTRQNNFFKSLLFSELASWSKT